MEGFLLPYAPPVKKLSQKKGTVTTGNVICKSDLIFSYHNLNPNDLNLAYSEKDSNAMNEHSSPNPSLKPLIVFTTAWIQMS